VKNSSRGLKSPSILRSLAFVPLPVRCLDFAILRRQLPRIAKCYWKNVLWSPSYFAASCGGAPLDGIKRYIEQQAAPL